MNKRAMKKALREMGELVLVILVSLAIGLGFVGFLVLMVGLLKATGPWFGGVLVIIVCVLIVGVVTYVKEASKDVKEGAVNEPD